MPNGEEKNPLIIPEQKEIEVKENPLIIPIGDPILAEKKKGEAVFPDFMDILKESASVPLSIYPETKEIPDVENTVEEYENRFLSSWREQSINKVEKLKDSIKNLNLDYTDSIVAESMYNFSKSLPYKEKSFSAYLGGSVNELYKGTAELLRSGQNILDALDQATFGAFRVIAAGMGEPQEFKRLLIRLGKDGRKELDKWDEKNLGPGFLNRIADWYDESAKGFKEMPETIFGDVFTGMVHIIPLIGGLYATPEIALPNFITNITKGTVKSVPKLATFLGTTSYFDSYAEIAKERPLDFQDRLKTYSDAGIGFRDGFYLHSIGVSAGMLGKLASELGLGKVLSASSSSLANGLGFMGLGGYQHYLETGEFDTRVMATQFGIGFGIALPGIRKAAGLEIKENLIKSSQRKALKNFYGAPLDVIRKANDFSLLKLDPYKLREESNKLGLKIGEESDIAKRSELLAAKTTIDNMLDINAITDDIIRNSEQHIKVIRKNDLLEDVEKNDLIDKINAVVAENDPIIQQTKPLTDKINNRREKIKTIEENKQLTDEAKEVKKKKLEDEIVETEKEIDNILKEPTLEKASYEIYGKKIEKKAAKEMIEKAEKIEDIETLKITNDPELDKLLRDKFKTELKIEEELTEEEIKAIEEEADIIEVSKGKRKIIKEGKEVSKEKPTRDEQHLIDLKEIRSFGKDFSTAMENMGVKIDKLHEKATKSDIKEAKERGVFQLSKEETEKRPERKEARRLERLLNFMNDVYVEELKLKSDVEEAIINQIKEIERVKGRQKRVKVELIKEEISDAERIRIETEKAGRKEKVESEEERRLRLRHDEELRLEAEKKEPLEEGTSEWIAEKSEDVNEIRAAWERESLETAEKKLTPAEQQLLGQRVNPESFNRFGDPNFVTKGIARSWFTKEGEKSNIHDIDVIAQEISKDNKIEFTPQDVVDFIVSHPGNYARKTTDLQRSLARRFREVTGYSIKNREFVDVDSDLADFNEFMEKYGPTHFGELSDLLKEHKGKLKHEQYEKFKTIIENEEKESREREEAFRKVDEKAIRERKEIKPEKERIRIEKGEVEDKTVELLNDLSKLSEAENPSEVGKKFAKLVNKGDINLERNIEFVEKLKEKQEIYRNRQDELLREKKDSDKSQIAEGLDDIMDAFGGKLRLKGEERIKAYDGLQKVAKGLVDLSMTNIEQLRIKVHRWLRDNISDRRKRRVLLRLLGDNDLRKILKDTKFELGDKGLDDNIQVLKKGLEDINFAIRTKKKEIIKVEDRTQTINEFSKLIRDRRAWIDVRNFNAAYLAWEIKKSIPKGIREIMPFIREGTSISDKLGRKDLQELYKEEIDGFNEKYGDALKKIESFYDVYWQEMVEYLDMMTGSQIQDYVNRIWDVPKNKRVDVSNWFTTSTKHQKKRYIATLKEGIEKFDLKPRTTDIAELIPLYASSVNNAVANRTFVKALKLFHRSGQPMVLPASQAPTGWSLVDHPSLREWVFKGEEKGTAFMSFEALKVHPDLKRLMGIIFDKRISLEVSMFGVDRDIIKGYEMTNAVFKKTWLTLSLFHHLALTETMFPKVSPRRAPKAFVTPFYYLFNPKKGSPAFENPELTGDALKYGVQLGASSDFNVYRIQQGLNTFAKRSEGVPGLEQFAKFVSEGNRVWDTALWTYLHDGFKLFAWEDVIMRVPRDYTLKQVEVWKGEQAELINDTFGGQNFDVLMMSPKMKQILGWSLLSMDWTISTLRQALGVTGFGKLDKSQKFWDQLGTKRSGARIRAKEAMKFWGRAVVIYGTMINLLNIHRRKADEEENPQYYMDRELSFWDRTMLGNTVGHKTHLFAGRYEDGSERYVRWGKQFREMPELIIDKDGLSFPKPMLKKIGGKTAPMLQMTSKAFTGKSPSGYEDWDLKNRRGWDWTLGLMLVLGKGTMPFSTSNFFRGDKQWKPTDLFYPSSKGMTKSQAIDLFKRGVDMKNGEVDFNYMLEIYEMAVLNNLPAFDLMRIGIANAKAEETIKVGEKLDNIDAIDEAIKKEKNKETILILENKKNRLIKDIEGVKASIAYYNDIENYLREGEDLVIKQKK